MEGTDLYHSELDKEAFELLNAGIAGTASETALVADWYQLQRVRNLQVIDETDNTDTVFSGKWNSGKLTVSADGRTITLSVFFEQDGIQYAYGAMEGRGEKDTLVALVRP